LVLENLPLPLPREVSTESQTSRPASIPLKNVAAFELSEGPNQISRDNAGVVVQAKVGEQVRLPSGGTWLTWVANSKPNWRPRPAAALRSRSAALSIREALLVFSDVPLAISGGILTLYLRGIPFSVSAAVGFIALSGIAVLNGLVFVTTTNHLRLRGENGEQAIVEVRLHDCGRC
jgi:heavy metal efflux system protein